MSPYPYTPSPTQADFNDPTFLEVFWSAGFAAGKTEALIQGAVSGVDDPAWHALLLKPTWIDVTLPGGLRDRLETLFREHSKINRNLRTLTFPSGARISYDYFYGRPLKDFRYRASAFNYIGIDEPETLDEAYYRLLVSRLRGPKARMRLTGVKSAEWQHRYFAGHGRVISGPALDNPGVSEDAVLRTVDLMSDEFRMTAFQGDWDLRSPYPGLSAAN